MFDRIKQFFASAASLGDAPGDRKPPVSAVIAWAVAHGAPASVLDNDDDDRQDGTDRRTPGR
ncbi:MAG: hypothetical protein ABWX74_02930 [Aeromicrobium sp.]